MNVRYKGHDDLVTHYDIKTEQDLISKINASFPKDQILSEETHSERRSLKGTTWIIDPIDGTTNFVHGYPVYCISIAVALENSIECAAVYNPIQGELYTALKGHGAYLNNRRLTPLKPDLYSKSLLVTGFPYRDRVPQERLQLALSLFTQFQTATSAIRRDGSAALDLCYVAAGRFSGFFETGLHPWDVAAGLLIAQEVGAIHVDFSGKPTTIFEQELVCAHPQLAKTIVEEIQSVIR